MNMRTRTLCLIVPFLSASACVIGQDMSNSIELSRLYIVGDACPSGWDLGQADELKKLDHGVFQWTGRLEAGKDFKFMNTREWHKHIVATVPDTKVTAGEDYHLAFYSNWGLPGEYDLKFSPKETGEYTLTVDLNSMRMNVSEPKHTAGWPERFYLAGTAVDNRVIEIPDCHGVERKTSVYLREGKVRIMDTPVETDETHYFRSLFEDVDISFGEGFHTPLYEADADYTWDVVVEGYYNLYLDNSSHTYRFKRIVPPKALYLVGGCCELGWNYWDKSNCIFRPSKNDPYLMVWEGELRIGWDRKTESDGTVTMPDEPDKFKILTAQDWFRDTYHPYVEDAPAIGESGARITGGDDLKWTISQNGRYRLELDIRTEILKGTLLEATGQEDTSLPALSGISEIKDPNANTEIRYFNLQGSPVPNPEKGIYIEVSGDKARKVMFM